jgi:hypothetical protein
VLYWNEVSILFPYLVCYEWKTTYISIRLASQTHSNSNFLFNTLEIPYFHVIHYSVAHIQVLPDRIVRTIVVRGYVRKELALEVVVVHMVPAEEGLVHTGVPPTVVHIEVVLQHMSVVGRAHTRIVQQVDYTRDLEEVDRIQIEEECLERIPVEVERKVLDWNGYILVDLAGGDKSEAVVVVLGIDVVLPACPVVHAFPTMWPHEPTHWHHTLHSHHDVVPVEIDHIPYVHVVPVVPVAIDRIPYVHVVPVVVQDSILQN